jgi:DNA (cytosine-5)-methyltransferase 1
MQHNGFETSLPPVISRQASLTNGSIVDLTPADVAGYTQVHFFAGIGGWSLAARLAGWPDDRPLWTGSCPCQPFSVAGKGEGQADARHLWPEFCRLIAGLPPDVIMGEQVAAAVGKSWLDGVCADLEGIGYACRAAVVPACAVDAPHRRNRLWFVADCNVERLERWPSSTQRADKRSAWSPSMVVRGADGKARRVKPGIRLLAHGVPARVGKLRAFGNAIVPQVAAEIIGAYMDCVDNPF